MYMNDLHNILEDPEVALIANYADDTRIIFAL